MFDVTLPSATLLSEVGEQLLMMLAALPTGACVPCSAEMMERSRDDALEATKELILNGRALATTTRCDICGSSQLVTVLRRRAA
jgi:hypothetical protein